jgi:hypothetical protein
VSAEPREKMGEKREEKRKEKEIGSCCRDREGGGERKEEGWESDRASKGERDKMCGESG